jgi:hypothetical protein
LSQAASYCREKSAAWWRAPAFPEKAVLGKTVRYSWGAPARRVPAVIGSASLATHHPRAAPPHRPTEHVELHGPVAASSRCPGCHVCRRREQAAFRNVASRTRMWSRSRACGAQLCRATEQRSQLRLGQPTLQPSCATAPRMRWTRCARPRASRVPRLRRSWSQRVQNRRPLRGASRRRRRSITRVR